MKKNSRICTVIEVMRKEDPRLNLYVDKINRRFASLLSAAAQLGKELAFFGYLLKNHTKAEIEKHFSGARQSHLLNFLAVKYRKFEQVCGFIKKARDIDGKVK